MLLKITKQINQFWRSRDQTKRLKDSIVLVVYGLVLSKAEESVLIYLSSPMKTARNSILKKTFYHNHWVRIAFDSVERIHHEKLRLPLDKLSHNGSQVGEQEGSSLESGFNS